MAPLKKLTYRLEGNARPVPCISLGGYNIRLSAPDGQTAIQMPAGATFVNVISLSANVTVKAGDSSVKVGIASGTVGLVDGTAPDEVPGSQLFALEGQQYLAVASAGDVLLQVFG